MFRVTRFRSFAAAKKDWLALEKDAPHYPFQSFWYQQLFAKEFCQQEDIYILGLHNNDSLLAIGGFEKIGDKIFFLGMKQVLGGQELTDYGDLLYAASVSEEQAKDIWETVINYFRKEGLVSLQLDFIREDSRTYRVFETIPEIHVQKQEIASALVVPQSWDDYMQLLTRKNRHELRRKLRRFEDQDSFHFCSEETIEKDFDDFIRLHRLSDVEKEKFMSEEMRKFFWEIVSAEKKDYRIDFCFLEIDTKRVAAVMSIIVQGKALIYNSGFDPEYSYYSVGLMLHVYLIKKSIEEK